MPGFKLVIAAKGFSKVTQKLAKIAEVAQRPSVPSMQASVWITGQTIQTFSAGGKPEKWAPISIMTAFIRSHRASKRTDSMAPMNDSGRLKGSFIPVLTDDGNQLGAATNVEYAGLMQSGGVSTANTVKIGSFKRRLPGSKGMVGFTAGGRKKYARGSFVTVEAYTMKLKGGATIPARPFFPEGLSELQSWGYLGKIQQIFNDYFNDTWKSVGGTD